MVYNGVLQVVMETGSSKPTYIQPLLTFQHMLLLLARSVMYIWMYGTRANVNFMLVMGKKNILYSTLQIFRGAAGCRSFEIDIFV